MVAVAKSLCLDMRLSVLKPLNGQWLINAIGDLKSNLAVIFERWGIAGIVSELQHLQNEKDHESPLTYVGEQS